MRKTIAVAAVMLAGFACTGEPTEPEVTAEAVVEYVRAETPGICSDFRQAYEAAGDSVGFQAFSRGYTADEPSAREVFNEFKRQCL